MIQTSSDSPNKSPMNALRHGLTSSVHVPEDKIYQVDRLRQELIRIHQPQSTDERDCISELALARWKMLETDRQMDLRIQAESEQAGMIFDRKMLDQFEIDEKLWHSHPHFRRDLLGQTYRGAALFEQLWSEILGALDSKIQRVSLTQARTMALMVGSSSKIHELSQDGLWLFSRFLKMENKPAQTILQWAQFSNTILVVGDTDFINEHFLSAANPATCHKELKQRALKEHAFWMLRKRDLEMEYATQRKQFVAMSMGTGLGDLKLANDARLALRYQITAQNRADKLTRRLDGLKRHRNLLEYRATKAEEREARRLELQSRDESATYTMMSDAQTDENELMNHELEEAFEGLAAMMAQNASEINKTQPDESKEVATAVQNKVVDQPVEVEGRLKDRIERMMKGRSRSEVARIKKQVKALRRGSEMAASV
jgi:hypothetical protein